MMKVALSRSRRLAESCYCESIAQRSSGVANNQYGLPDTFRDSQEPNSHHISYSRSGLLSDRIIVLSRLPAVVKEAMKVDLAKPISSATRATKSWRELSEQEKHWISFSENGD
jgi:hypothetical protein